MGPDLSGSPEKVAAEGTECRLAGEFGHKLVAFNLVDLVMFDGAATSRDATAA